MNKSKYFATYFFIGILFLAFFCIMLRTVTRQVLVKRLNVDNAFTKTVLFDQRILMTEDLATDNENVRVTAVDIKWDELYPFSNTETIEETINQTTKESDLVQRLDSLKTNVDFYTSDFLPFYSGIVELSQNYKLALKWHLKPKADEVSVLKMENGYLTYSSPLVNPSDMEDIANSVLDFDTFLKSNGIDFYYINAGSKVDPDNKYLDDSCVFLENTNENADNLLSSLESKDISTIDMREYMKEDNLDWYGSYYKTDIHWTNRTALWAAQRIAQKLNEDNGFEYDLGTFDESNYSIEQYDDFWYGTQAVSLMLSGCQKESYSTILPKFDTQLIVDIPPSSYHAKGDYRDVIFKEELLEEIKTYSDDDFLKKVGPYGLVVFQNDSLATIINEAGIKNSDKKILIIQDSFGWYLSSFLACQTGQIDLLYLENFDGSVQEYVRQTNPDIVLLMYAEQNIKPIDWDTHNSFFDLR